TYLRSRMNLHETLGLIAIGAGIGGSVGGANCTILSIAAAVGVGLTAGAIAYLAGRKVVIQMDQPTERELSFLYGITFLGVLLATWAAASGTLAIAASLSR